MYRRELIQNLSMLSLAPLIPCVLNTKNVEDTLEHTIIYCKQYFEHCQVFKIEVPKDNVAPLYGNSLCGLHAFLEQKESHDLIVVPMIKSRNDITVFNKFKQMPDFKNNKYIYIVTCGKYTGYVISDLKLS